MLKMEQIAKDTERARKYFEDRVAFTMGPVELKKAINNKENIVVVDVRKAEDYKNGHIPGAISIPATEFEDRINELSKDKVTILYCYTQQCHLAAKSALKLASKGYPVIELEGGMKTWQHEYGFEVQS